MNSLSKHILSILLLLLTACSGTRHLPQGEKLYTGAKIKLVTSEKVNKAAIKATAANATRPAPNTNYFGMRPLLVIYQWAGVNPQKKYKKWLQKVGEAPVFIRDVKPAMTASIIDSKLFNIGIFNSFTEYKTVDKKHTSKLIYTCHIHKPYSIKELTYSISDDSLNALIQLAKENTLIKIGQDFNLETLKNERIRIDAFLKNKGYFYFNPDYLLFKTDTLNKDKTVSFTLSLKTDLPKNALNSYRIRNVYINQNYSLKTHGQDNKLDTLLYENTVFVGRDSGMHIRPKVILQSVYFKTGEIYSRENHNITLNRLMTMGTFKFVQMKFTESDSTNLGFLDVSIYMTPMTNRSFRAEMDLISKSNDYSGPRLNVSLLNRNPFHGAELLNMSLAGSFEAQLGGSDNNSFSYSWNPQVELSFPRFIIPFVNLKHSHSYYIPRTSITLSYNYLKRVDYFDMSTFQFMYGFKWKGNIKNEHEFYPLKASFSSTGKRFPAFVALMTANPYLNQSYKDQFIAGSGYYFTYNEQLIRDKKTQFYVHLAAETAGNAFSLIKNLGGVSTTAENPAKVFNTSYSQYVSLSLDNRMYLKLTDKNKIALRLFAGMAMPYGNSATLPYSKKFFSGGPSSIRAFSSNSLGPGNYKQTATSAGFLQLGGNIKLEINAEYRFGIYKVFKGALFMDAGNVWLEESNPWGIGNTFTMTSLLNELAIGAGLGLRIDLSFLLLRFDLATPLRKPWLEPNRRWVANQIDITSSTWRNENLILNVAIGYPF